MIIRRFASQDGQHVGYLYWCPGCDEPHGVYVNTPNDGGHRWNFNGNEDSPTFTPSLLIKGFEYGPFSEKRFHPTCHCFITDGKIQFLGDCTHPLANQTVPIPDWEKAVGVNYQIVN